MAAERALSLMAFVIASVAVKAGCIAMSIWLDKAAPAFTARAVNAYQARGLRCFLQGLANGVVLFLLFVVSVKANIKPFAALGVLLGFATIGAVITGYLIAYHDVGRRIRGERDWSATQTILFGGMTAEAAFFAPILGQLFSLGVLFRGLGAVISALLSRDMTDSSQPGAPG